MKKFLCLALSFIFIINTFVLTVFYSLGADNDGVPLSDFVSGAKEMISEFGLYETKSNGFQVYSSDSPEEYQTRRLIVKSESDIDTLNAVSVVSGFRNLWVLQFETVEDTATAYEYYNTLDYIEFVETDSIITVSESENAETVTASEEYLSWGPEHVGFDELNEIIAENNIKLETVYVAVIDTGVDYNHEFLTDRVEITTFNSSDSGNENDPLDDDDHGTHVAGIIADCTPNNVIIRPYKCLNSKGEGTDLTISLGIYQAADDGNGVINMSFGTTENCPLVEDALEYAKEKSDPVMVAAMGNSGTNSSSAMPLPAKSPLVIGVSALSKNNEKVSNSNFNKNYTEFTAPGGTINSTVRNNKYKEMSGTSMAAPFVSAVAATAKALYPSCDAESIRSLMQETAVTLTTDIESWGYFGYGLVYATGILRDVNISYDMEYPKSPIFSLEEGLYDGTIELEMFCEDDTKIYYTTDGSIPSKNSLLYDGNPITISETTLVMAAAYKDGLVKSPLSSAYYGIPRVCGYPVFSVFVFNGYVFDLRTDYAELEISEIYNDMVGNSVAVKGIDGEAFHDNRVLKYLKMPDAVTEIQYLAFESCINLKTVVGNGVEIIGDEVFINCSSLNRVCLENTQSVGKKAFGNCSSLQEINLPKVTSIGDFAFSGCENLSKIDLSGIKSIDSENVFANVSPDFVDLRSLESTKSLPDNSSVLFSSKLSNVECFPKNLTIYGTKGTYAEKYANENGYSFIPVPYIQNDLPDTAVMADTLTVEAIGINLSYQWFSSEDGATNNGVSIEGEFSENLTLSKTTYAPYYYCVVTCNDNGILSSAITNVVRNLDYDYSKLPADYSALDEVISEIPEDLSIYTDESVAKLKSIEESIDRNLDITNQEKIAEYVEAVKKAIEELDVKPADYSELEKVLSTVPTDLSVYTEESVATLQEIIDSIDYSLDITQQEQVDKYVIVITNAITKLKLKPADYSELEELLKAVPADLSIYTDESVANLKSVEENIDRNLDITNQEKIAEYVEAVKKAIEELDVKPADYSELEKVLSTVPTDLSVYTEESVATLQEIIDSIDYSLDITQQEQVDKYVIVVTNAITKLKLKPADYSELEELLKAVPADLSIYTDESVANLKSVEENIDRNLDITNQEKIVEYVEAVKKAIEALEFKPADYTILDEVLSEIPEDLSIYTEESVTNLEAVEKGVNKNLDITQQDIVDGYVVAVEQALSKLKYRPADYSLVFDAIETIPNDLSIYTPKSVDELESIVDGIDYGLDITQQDKVDEYAERITQATNNLEKECWLIRLFRMIISFFKDIISCFKNCILNIF